MIVMHHSLKNQIETVEMTLRRRNAIDDDFLNIAETEFTLRRRNAIEEDFLNIAEA